MRRSIALVLALVALSGCKKNVVSENLPSEQVTSDDLLRELERAKKGEKVGESLRAPKIEVDLRGITINGQLVVPMSDIDSKKVGKIDKESDWLKGLKEHWKMVHPSDMFDGDAQITIAGDVPTPVAASALFTAAMAGFARAYIKVGALEWSGPFFVPLPPSPVKAERGGHDVKVTLTRGASGYDLSTTSLGSPCVHNPSAGKGDTLRALLTTACAGAARCVVALEPSSDPFATVAALLAPALAPGAPANVVLDANPARSVDGGVATCSERPDPSAPTAPWGRDDTGPIQPGNVPTGPKVPPKLREGAATFTGRLPPEVVKRIVRQNWGRFRLCYESGLRSNAKLEGRVTVKFVIDAEGHVSEAADSGSDLPDQAVVQCIVGAIHRLDFPKPEGGIVTVVYPILFTPS